MTSCDNIMWHHMMSPRHNVTSHVVTSLAMSLRWDQTSLNNAELLCNEFSPGDLDLWPMTFSYNPSPAKVKVNSHTKSKVIGQTVRPWELLTDGQTDRQTDKHRNTASILWPRPVMREVTSFNKSFTHYFYIRHDYWILRMNIMGYSRFEG